MRWIAGLVVCSSTWFAAAPALAQGDPSDIARRSPPFNWLSEVLPESADGLRIPEWASDLERAEVEVAAGRYRRALYSLGGDAMIEDDTRTAIVRVRALTALGRHDEALARLTERDRNSPVLAVLHARLLGQIGRLDDAIALLKPQMALFEGSAEVRYELGRLLELRGRYDEAREVYAWFVEGPTNYMDAWRQRRERDYESASRLVAIARGIDRWATLGMKYPELPGLNDAVLAMLTAAYDVVDREYWPARVAAAEYFLAHNNTQEAIKELSAAASANPHDERALELLGRVALDGFNFDGVDQAIAAIRSVNPASLVADLLEARNFLLQRRPADAEPALRRVLDRQPQHIEALGLLAAVRSLQLRDDESKQILAQIDQIAPNNPIGYFEVAEQLAALRQYPRSAEMYKVAIERAPWWTNARNGLGLLYTQSGDEDDARIVLRDAYNLDPYNARTLNYLTLLDRMAGFEKVETEHFIILHDKTLDPIIGKLFAGRLEAVHAEVAKAFDHTPEVKTIIEVFPTHAGFSVRTTGAPWIGTVGASTGRVIALVSPRKEGSTLGPFNWLQVMRHEYVHTVTLSKTENRIPHWMTEGLAVLEEQSPMRWDWVPMLYHTVKQNELFTMEGLTWGFVRPRRPHDRQLAYAQSYWVCKFIDDKWGRPALLDMLRAFRDGGTEPQVFEQVLKTDRDAFYEQFVVWANEQVDGWGYDNVTTAQYDQLREEGERLIRDRKFEEAVTVWQQAQKLRPVDSLPHQRLAGLYLTRQINQPERAAEHLAILAEAELKDNRYAKRVARLLRDRGEMDGALKFADIATLVQPYDLEAHELVLELARKQNNADRIAEQEALIAMIKPWQAMMKDQQRLPDAPAVAE